MNTKEFMAVLNLNRPSSISNLIEGNIINPEKIGKFYNYTQKEIDDYAEYKRTGIRKYAKQLDTSTAEECLKAVSTHSLVIELLERTDIQRRTK